MKISIAERFRPFTHLIGTPVLLPLSNLRFQIYPAFIRVCDLSAADPVVVAEVPLDLQGPLIEFTLMQDLEKGCLRVWGVSKDGFFRYRIHATSSVPGFTFIQEKFPGTKPLSFSEIDCRRQISQPERLSFGVTKVADWELVRRRLMLAEILPFWFRLGQYIPSVETHNAGVASLLDELKNAILKKESLELSLLFKELYSVGFEGLLSCNLTDAYHQGLKLPKVPEGSSCSPLVLLTEGTSLIRRMLIDLLEPSHVEILPCLLPELHSGRLCGVFLSTLGTIDLEWSKKEIRRMIFRSTKRQIISFHFQHEISSFRLREATSTLSLTKTCGEAIEFAENSTYFFDHFLH